VLIEINNLLIQINIFKNYFLCNIYIMLESLDVETYLDSKDYSDSTRRQYLWRINKMINEPQFAKSQKWYFALFKDLKHYQSKNKVNLKNDVKIINLQKELEIYKMNLSIDEVDRMNQLLSTINNIGKVEEMAEPPKGKPKIEEKVEDYAEMAEPPNGGGKEVEIQVVKREDNEDFIRIRKKYLKEKRVREEAEVEHKAEKDKLLVQIQKYQQMAIKYQKLYEELLLSTQNQEKKTYSSDEDENCGYGK